MNENVSKSNFAKLLGASRSTITAQCAKGLPQTKDGRIPRQRALEFLAHNCSGYAGGWTAGIRGRDGLGQRAARILAGKPASEDASPKTEAAPLAIDIESDFWRGAFFMMNALRSPKRRGTIAQFCLSFGCSAWQAWAITGIYDLLLAGWGTPEGYEDAPIVEFYEGQEPDWAHIAELAGEPLDLKAWGRAARKRAREFDKKNPNCW